MSSSRLSKSPTPPIPIPIPSLQPHQISPTLAAFPPDAAPSLFLSHPSARLSSSPASSPRIVDSPPLRTRSIKPEMSDFMDKGMAPGADFFEDSSGDENSDWEDDGTGHFSEIERLVQRRSGDSHRGIGLGLGHDGSADDEEEEMRGRRLSRDSEVVTALPPFNQLPATMLEPSDATATEEESPDSPLGSCRPKKARQMSIRPLTKEHVQIVQSLVCGAAGPGEIGIGLSGHETPLASLSSPSCKTPPEGSPKLRQAWPDMRLAEGGGRGLATLPRPAPPFHERKRRNTCESIRADSIINAHAITLRALEALSPTASLSRTRGRSFSTSTMRKEFSKSEGFAEQRRGGLSQLTSTENPNRNLNLEKEATGSVLPAHFINTPYPFTARKEFPKPPVRPRQHDLFTDSAAAMSDLKAANGPGIVPSGGEFDLRSLLERNVDSAGHSRSCATTTPRRREKMSWHAGEGEHHESIVWLSLRRRKDGKSMDEGVASKLVRIEVPSSLTVESEVYGRGGKWKRSGGCAGLGNGNEEKGTLSYGREKTVVDFDDQFLAERLREGYCAMAGSWFTRTFSARKLKYIRLGSVNVWSGSVVVSPHCEGLQSDRLDGPTTSNLLAARDGINSSPDCRSPFTERNLLNLYRNPKSGKARYTWVHWARRVAASNTSLGYSTSISSLGNTTTRRHKHRANSLDIPFHFNQAVQGNGGATATAATADNDDDEKELPTPSTVHQTPRPRTTSLSPSARFHSYKIPLSNTITTIQFIHTFSAIKLFISLLFCVLGSVVAALAWIFAGRETWEDVFFVERARAERVGGGMGVGILVLLVEGVIWCGWVVGSWRWG